MDATTAVVQFLRVVEKACGDLAENLLDASAETTPPPASRPLDPADENLGVRQLEIVRLPGLNTDDGLKTAEIADQTDRDDVPNTYMSLQALAKRGIVELIPGKAPQRWRLTRRYRHEAA